MFSTSAKHTLNCDKLQPGVIVLDPGRRVSYADERACELLGLDAKAVIGQACEDLPIPLPCNTCECEGAETCPLMNASLPGAIGTVDFFHKKGYLASESHVMRNSLGVPLGVIHFVHEEKTSSS